MAAWLKNKLTESIDHWKSLWADPWKDKEQDEDAANKDILLDECISRLGFGKFQVKLLFIVSIIWIADAMEMMMIGFITPALACEFNLTNSSKAVLTTMIFLGMLFGAFAWGIFDDRFGRKKGMLANILRSFGLVSSLHQPPILPMHTTYQGYFASVLFTFFFGILCPFSPNYYVLCVLRMLVGFGVAGSHVAITIFSEFLPSSKRALFIIVIAAFWVSEWLEARHLVEGN